MPERLKLLAEVALPSATMGGIGGILRVALQPAGWFGGTCTLVLAITMATIVGVALDGHVSPKWAHAISGLCGAVARELALGLVKLAGHFRRDPLGTARRFFFLQNRLNRGQLARRHDSDPLP